MIQIGIWCVGALSLLNLVLIILALKRIADSRKETAYRQSKMSCVQSVRKYHGQKKRLETKFEKGIGPLPRH